jgi:hypothetical protein
MSSSIERDWSLPRCIQLILELQYLQVLLQNKKYISRVLMEILY